MMTKGGWTVGTTIRLSLRKVPRAIRPYTAGVSMEVLLDRSLYPYYISPNVNITPCGGFFGGIHASMNSVFCDGSTRSISFMIDPVVFLSICTCNGGEPGDDFECRIATESSCRGCPLPAVYLGRE